MLVLGLETSCDESGVALYDTDRGLLGHALYSQVDLHRDFGGVVPELASRDHIRTVLPLLDSLLTQAQVKASDIEGVAYTVGPGLMGALFAGAVLGRSLAYGWQVPALGVHHMEGHLLTPFLVDSTLEFPFLVLLVSGGHTQLVWAECFGCYRLLGETLDDAAGEAFDKVASLLSLDYPGGPALAQLAECAPVDVAQTVKFPRPMVQKPGLNFSFSGLKTHCLHVIEQLRKKNEWNEQRRVEVAYAFQEAVVDSLLVKCVKAVKETKTERLVLAGGVSANQHLRRVFQQTFAQSNANLKLFFPPAAYCTDNGAMIAYAGALRLLAGEADQSLGIRVLPRWSLESLSPPSK